MTPTTRLTGILTSLARPLLTAVVALQAVSVLAQSPHPTSPLVFDGVTVIDVQTGARVPEQRVVIDGPRITAMGNARAVPLPARALVVDARGKYLIPGLWDMHVHTHADISDPLFIANGVTGIRDAGSPIPLATLQRWRREILAGTRIGPPRQILSGQSIGGPEPGCDRRDPKFARSPTTCVADSADARYYVDSLQAAGVDMIKPRSVDRSLYFAIAAEARRRRLPFGGHAEAVTVIEAADSGASIVDHLLEGSNDMDRLCVAKLPPMEQITRNLFKDDLKTASARSDTVGSLARCRLVAAHFVQHGTWWVPTLHAEAFDTYGPKGSMIGTPRTEAILSRFTALTHAFWADSAPGFLSWVTDSVPFYTVPFPGAGEPGFLYLVQEAGVPLLAGTDIAVPAGGFVKECDMAGFALHTELALMVANGISPLTALQSATLNPAKLLHATDSLGTVAPGKLADLVLLDADPLVNIGNTTRIRAVVATGRYFDRAALDKLIMEARPKMQAFAKAREHRDGTTP